MYGIAGERRLDEYELDWLPGYEDSTPVRVGNAAADQFQLDVYGEVVGVAAPGALGAAGDRHGVGLEPRLGLRRAPLAQARRGHLGGARRRAALHPLEGDGLGRRSTGPSATRRSFGLEARCDGWWRIARRDPRDILENGLR